MAAAPAFARAGADALPFADASFDAVVACLVFEHIDDVDEAIAEVARVLAPGGRFCFFLNHPLLQTPDSGWIDDQILDPPEQYWRIGPYLVEEETIEEVEKDVLIRFIHRPLSRYVNALADNGLLDRADGRAGAAARASSPAPRSTPTRRRSRGCCTSEPASSLVSSDRAEVADIVLITGLSGAGRSAAADVLEDLGWYVVDNLPTSLVEKIVELALDAGQRDRAAGARVRPPPRRPCSTPSPRCAPPATASPCCSSTPATPSSCSATTPPAASTRSTTAGTGCVEAIELERALLERRRATPPTS